MILTLFGENATRVALLANRLPEVMDSGNWRGAHSHGEARRFLRLGTTTVRLRIDDRILLEDITKQSIPLDTDLNALVANLLAATDPPAPLAEALSLYQGVVR